MQHEPLRQPLLAENAGDVLASIRRLIAQDDSGRPLPGRPFVDHPFHRPARPVAEDMPLVLGQADLIAGEVARPASAAAPALPAAVEWQPAIIADWPHARVVSAPAATAAPQPVAVAPADMAEAEPAWSELTPEEQAEFAEAEAVLARMTASARPPSLSPAQTAEIVEFPLAEPAQDVAVSVSQAAPAPVPNLFAQTVTAEAGEDLRQAIRDVIRQELEGGMGDRFSHNLRLLVRAEVETVIRGLCAEG